MGGASSGTDYVGLVFVYGTLKRGERYHEELGGAIFEGSAELRGLELYNLGPFPMAISNAQAQTPVSGEIYRVTPQQLQALDRFEGAPRLYQRELRSLLDGRRAWVYLGSPQQVRFVQAIPSGSWSESDRHQQASRRGHGHGPGNNGSR
jgi:gamma-glutamylcyclotransferase (GGCT)/AIG2-like uncharacterized protein YtfP